MTAARTPRHWIDPTPRPGSWPRPPACLPAAQQDEPPAGARVAVAGLVLLRQRPGTAKGVIFLTLEDETGTVNVVVWAQVYERFRRAVIAGRLLRVTGKLQREAGVVHVVAELIEDLSYLLDRLLLPGFAVDGHRAGDQP
jgi:DNA polymerase III alpha subunit